MRHAALSRDYLELAWAQRMHRLPLSLLCVVLAWGCLANTARASLLTNVSYNRQIDYYITSPFVGDASLPFVGTSLPASGTRELISPIGGVFRTSYDFSDNGSSAEFHIGTSYYLPPASIGQNFNEQGVDVSNSDPLPPQPITFTAEQPLRYTVWATNAFTASDGLSYAMVRAELYGQSPPGSPVTQLFSLSNAALDYTSAEASIPVTSGIIEPGTYSFYDTSHMHTSTSNPNYSSSISGASTLLFLLTPVPEPTAASLLASGGLVLAAAWFCRQCRASL